MFTNHLRAEKSLGKRVQSGHLEKWKEGTRGTPDEQEGLVLRCLRDGYCL